MLIQARFHLQQSLKCSSTKSIHSLSCATLLVFSGLQGLSFSFLLHFTRISELGKYHFSCLYPSCFEEMKGPLLHGCEMKISFSKGQKERCLPGTGLRTMHLLDYFLFALDPATNILQQNLLLLFI